MAGDFRGFDREDTKALSFLRFPGEEGLGFCGMGFGVKRTGVEIAEFYVVRVEWWPGLGNAGLLEEDSRAG